MNSQKTGKNVERPFVLGKRGEEILRVVHFYRYMTALDITYLFYSPRSITRVRSLLALMCGGGDFIGNQYLYRFCVPHVTSGNPERIYILGSRGREFLENEGLTVNWYFCPEKVKQLSYSQVTHNIAITRCLVAARRWAAMHSGFSLREARICYELAAANVEVDEGGKREKVAVIPDAWLLFEKAVKGKAPVQFPVLLEIDRGTMYRERFKKHVLSRVEFVRSGGYRLMFGQEAVVIAYATTGATGDAQEGRRKALCLWTQEALRDIGKESWAPVFRFHSLSLEEIYENRFFEGNVWYRPDEKPVRLIGE